VLRAMYIGIEESDAVGVVKGRQNLRIDVLHGLTMKQFPGKSKGHLTSLANALPPMVERLSCSGRRCSLFFRLRRCQQGTRERSRIPKMMWEKSSSSRRSSACA